MEGSGTCLRCEDRCDRVYVWKSVQYPLQPRRGCTQSYRYDSYEEKSGFSILGISVAGGVSHNIGQLIIASLITMTSGLIYYAPALLISGVITGLLIGTLTSEVLKRIRF